MLRPKLNRIWASANASETRDPGDAKYITGWIAEIPTFQVLNYLQNKVDTAIYSLAQRGVFEWGNDIAYLKGAIAWDETNSIVYVSTVANPNKTLKPSSNLTQWAPSSVQITRTEYDVIVSKTNNHISDVTSNPHKVTAALIGAYTVAQIDALVAQYNALVKAHVDDKNNPHGVTALNVGAVPSTGGTYTGAVTFQQLIYFDAAKTQQIYNTGGLFLKNGIGILGVDTAGVGWVGTTSSRSKILTEALYLTLKQEQEAIYAAPSPNFQIPFIGSTNLLLGSGMVNDNNDNTLYNTQGELIAVPNNQSLGLYGTVPVAVHGGAGTVCVDVCFMGNPASSSSWAGVVGMYGWKILWYSTGNITVEVRSATGLGTINQTAARAAGDNGVWHRFVAVYDGAGNFKIYVDGVLKLSGASTPNAAATAANVLEVRTNGGSSAPVTYIKNFRIWDTALTEKQVSTL